MDQRARRDAPAVGRKRRILDRWPREIIGRGGRRLRRRRNHRYEHAQDKAAKIPSDHQNPPKAPIACLDAAWKKIAQLGVSTQFFDTHPE
jgi:hypothetical protein